MVSMALLTWAFREPQPPVPDVVTPKKTTISTTPVRVDFGSQQNTSASTKGLDILNENQQAGMAEHVADVKRIVQEESRMLGVSLGLNPGQLINIQSILEQHRLGNGASGVSEYDLITSQLNAEQKSSYDSLMEERRRSDAAQFATVKIGAIENVTGPLTDEQKDQIFQSCAGTLIGGQAKPDAEILHSVLTKDQFELWKKSSQAAAQRID